MIDLGHKKFLSAKKMRRHFQTILQTHKLNVHLRGGNFHDLYALIWKHPRAAAKIGAGVKAFEVREISFSGQRERCFFVRRQDGSEDHFSYKKCIHGAAGDGWRVLMINARGVIQDQLRQYRDEYFKAHADSDGLAPSELSGSMMTKDEANVDHVEPRTFRALVRRWINLMADRGQLSEVFHERDGAPGPRFGTLKHECAFKAWHGRNASLRVVTRQENTRHERMKK